MSYRASLMLKHKGRCFYCNANLCYAEATTDHFIPRKRGGPNCEGNRVLACSPCNSAKGSINPVDLGIWHPEETSPRARQALLLLRRLVIKRQLSKLRQRSNIRQQFPGLPAKADPLAMPILFNSLKVLPIDGRVLLLPHRERTPKKDSG